MCVGVARLLAADFTARFQALRKAAPAIVAACSMLTLAYTGSLVHAMAGQDPRDAAADAIENSAPQGASVAFAKTPWYFSPPLSPWFGEMSAPARRKSTDSQRFKIILPADGTEFDAAVFSPIPDFFVISNIETINERRLQIPVALNFLKAIPADMQPKKYAPPALFDMAFSGAYIPDDLAYILPEITVYSRK
jgi:hypothetical protein